MRTTLILIAALVCGGCGVRDSDVIGTWTDKKSGSSFVLNKSHDGTIIDEHGKQYDIVAYWDITRRNQIVVINNNFRGIAMSWKTWNKCLKRVKE